MAKGGYMGKILRVDLTTKQVNEEKLNDDDLRKYERLLEIKIIGRPT